MASPPPASAFTPSSDPGGQDREDSSDLDPAAFLKSVRELSEKREREDAERYRKLEEEVEKGRQERAARRAERARSISPQKPLTTSASSSRPLSRIDLSTPPKMTSPGDSASTSHTDSLQRLTGSSAECGNTPSSNTSADAVPEFKGFGSTKRSSALSTASSQTGKDASESSPQPSATSLARSGTLSWQQRRPNSRIGGSRPVSMVEPTKVASSADTAPSRDQIAAQLSTRDPTWFRQTSDRGIGSAAYRKSKDELSPDDSVSVVSGRRGLPGMSRESSIEPGDGHGSPHNAGSAKPDTAPKTTSARESIVSSGSRFSATSTDSGKPDLKSLIAADDAQQRASPAHDNTADVEPPSLSRASTMSSSQARLAGALQRPVSPTKGMGGFVQSALMKRSDSVSKRGSIPASTLHRQNSLASQVSADGRIQKSKPTPKLEPTVGTDVNASASIEPDTKSTSSISKDPFVKPNLPRHSRSRSVVSSHSASGDAQLPQSPSSPSKRWSPNKSSWIESALKQPDAPKPIASKNSQPSWMANLAKAKAQRSSADSTTKAVDDPSPRQESPTKSTPFGPGMLKRSSTKDLSTTPLPAQMKPVEAIDKPMPSSTGRMSPEKPTSPLTMAAPSHTNSSATLIGSDEPRSREVETSAASKTSGLASEAAKDRTETESNITTAALPTMPKPKPETAPKPQTDFRSSLRPRAPTESKPKEAPEFLSKVGTLRKTQQEKYVAPDTLKDNILRGKSGLNLTGGPVKTERKDEFKESINAKKSEMQKAKDEGRDLPGQVHERKTSGTKQPPPKPEALTRRELLTRSDSIKVPAETSQPTTPEALARHKSLKQKPALEKAEQSAGTPTSKASFAALEKQVSAPAAVETTEKSRLAARFNPGLAGLLARGPPSASNPPSRSESPATSRQVLSEPQTNDAPLQDMRKDRAKGPKRRKGAASAQAGNVSQPEQANPIESTASTRDPILSTEMSATENLSTTSTMSPIDRAPQVNRASKDRVAAQSAPVEPILIPKTKPQALPGSAASIMMASLNKPSKPAVPPNEQAAHVTSPKSSSSAQSPLPSPRLMASIEASKPNLSEGTAAPVIPEFKGFGASKVSTNTPSKPEENKENAAQPALPSVKSAASMWGRRPSPQKAEPPTQMRLPTRQDEEAAMQSAGLASSSGSMSGQNAAGPNAETARASSTTTPQASPGLPPKPTKSSRVVSGQLSETSLNKDFPNVSTADQPSTEAGRVLLKAFGTIPKSPLSLAIDTQAVLAAFEHRQSGEDVKTLRKSVQEILSNGSTEAMPPQEEYTLFAKSVYLCTHHYSKPNSVKVTQVFVWAGSSASDLAVDAATASARRVARENGGAPSQTIRQGHETPALLQAVGGILVTRRGSRVNASKQYMLCGRKHLGHIVFDEVDFAPESLCAGFVYLVSVPVTLQDTKLYVWKGSSCSTEELSAARLAAMDLSETGEIIEVDGGAEFPSFLKAFGGAAAKASIPSPSGLWQQKAQARNKFAARLFRIQAAELRASIMTALWSRRPTWGNLSAASSPAAATTPEPEDVRVEAKHLSPFSQASLEAEGIYVLDAYFCVYVLVGPLATQLGQTVVGGGGGSTSAMQGAQLLAQALLFASDYAILATSMEDRPDIPTAEVVFAGVPADIKRLFRQWDEAHGLWGTAGLMAGIGPDAARETTVLGLEEVIREVIVRG